MDFLNYIDLAITLFCVFVMAFYFNHREKALQKMAENKIVDLKSIYIKEALKVRENEEKEIDKIKTIVKKLEGKHKEVVQEQKKNITEKEKYRDEADQIIKNAQKRAESIEQEIRANAQKFFEEQKTEVQAKMVDLVIGVSQRVLSKGLDYDEHKELIKEALAEVEGEIVHEQ